MEAVRASAAWVASRSTHVTVDLQGIPVDLTVSLLFLLNLWFSDN
jgi:hypothetical protein